MNILREIWATARRNKLRTTLTGCSVAWGIFMLIFLLGSGNGLINATKENQFKALPNSMGVWGGRTSKPYAGMKEGRMITLDTKDISTTSKEFKAHVDEVGAVVSSYDVTLSLHKNYLVSQQMKGVLPIHQQLNKLMLLEGRFINEGDLKERRKVMVLDHKQAKELSDGRGSLVGQLVKANGMMFRVVGIVQADETRQSSVFYAPLTTVSTIYGQGEKVEMIEYAFHGLPTEEDNDAFEDDYRRRINANHIAAPDDENAIWLWNRYTSNMQMEKGLNILTTALWVVGLFTLLSGVVGVSNIMLITVKERTRELGIRKAIGATPWNILKLIIIESIIITSLFGYLGMFCGVAVNEYMNYVSGNMNVDTGLFTAKMFVNPTVGIDVCVEATLVIILAGTVAGLIPAWKAARIRPIEAMRE